MKPKYKEQRPDLTLLGDKGAGGAALHEGEDTKANAAKNQKKNGNCPGDLNKKKPNRHELKAKEQGNEESRKEGGCGKNHS